MSYSYAAEKSKLFTDQGQREFLKARDVAQAMLRKTGAFRQSEFSSELCSALGAVDSWFTLAALDRMIELGELVALRPEGSCWAQYQIYAAPQVHNR